MPERICEISVGRNKCYAVEDNLFQYRIILSVTEGNLHDLNAFVLCFLCFCLFPNKKTLEKFADSKLMFTFAIAFER